MEKKISVGLNLTFRKGWIIRIPHNLQNLYSGFHLTIDRIKVRSIEYKKVNGLRLFPGEFNFNDKFIFLALARDEKKPIVTFEYAKHAIESNVITHQHIKPQKPSKSDLYGMKKTTSKIKWGTSAAKGEVDRTLQIHTTMGTVKQVCNSLMLGNRVLATIDSKGNINYLISPITDNYLFERIQNSLEIGTDGKKLNMKVELMKHAPR